MSVLAYIGLGSNMGDPIEHVLAARTAIGALPQVRSIRTSSMYSSSPVGYLAQADFINCVLELECAGSIRSLFDDLQSIELSLGRVRDQSNQNAPRTIDIDLLLFGDESVNQPDLIVPHPRMHQRLFVLLPLQELTQALVNGILGRALADTEADFPGQRIQRLSL